MNGCLFALCLLLIGWVAIGVFYQMLGAFGIFGLIFVALLWMILEEAFK